MGNNQYHFFLFDPDRSNNYGSTSNAFIFSLHDNEGLAPFKSMVKYSSRAIYKHEARGPTFGSGHDISIGDDADKSRVSFTEFGHSYHLPSGVKEPHTVLASSRYFSPDEVEVFYLA